jgi:thiamine kinase-like enzyme
VFRLWVPFCIQTVKKRPFEATSSSAIRTAHHSFRDGIRSARNRIAKRSRAIAASLSGKSRNREYVIRIYNRHTKNVESISRFPAVASFIKDPPFQIPEKALTFYKEMVSSVKQKTYELLELPKQLVHHDLLIYNLLSKDNRIYGVLDFDFTSFDISFMEFTISPNHVIQLTNGSLDLTENDWINKHRSSIKQLIEKYLL